MSANSLVVMIKLYDKNLKIYNEMYTNHFLQHMLKLSIYFVLGAPVFGSALNQDFRYEYVPKN